MQQSPENLCDYLRWDSEFFGYRIARLLPSRLSLEALQKVQAWCHSNSIDCLYCLVDAADEFTVRLAEQNGFNLVDIRLTLSRGLGESETRPTKLTTGTIRPALAEDLPVLHTIARQSHHDTRFYYDPHFDKPRCDALYEIWIENSCQGYADAVLVAENEKRVAGYITCKTLEAKLGQIGLLAVDRSAAGLGLGSALIRAALDWFRDRGKERVLVVTQGRNIAAQRCYQRNGFMSESLLLSYHRWFCPRQASHLNDRRGDDS
jgi:dTDP-4-amino-4,6-dideoxy-D-galactose acyltransferase